MAGSHAEFGLEGRRKVIGRAEAQPVGDLLQGLVARAEKALGALHADSQEVLARGNAGADAELPAEMRVGYPQRLGELRHGDRRIAGLLHGALGLRDGRHHRARRANAVARGVQKRQKAQGVGGELRGVSGRMGCDQSVDRPDSRLEIKPAGNRNHGFILAERSAPEHAVQQGAAYLNPLLNPTGVREGAVAVPGAGKEQHCRACLDIHAARGPAFKLPAPKPIMAARLDATLARWCPAAGTKPVQGKPARSTGVLDAAILRDLRELQDQSAPGLLAELCDTYLEDAMARVALLREAEAREDWETVRRTAHALKGGSAAIGAILIARLCVQIETQARAMDGAGLRASLSRLDVLLDLTRLHLRAELDPTGGV